MNISSILITIIGIIIILALYVVSRLGQNTLTKNESTVLPDLKDDKGEEFTSVLDDIAAKDGSAITTRKPEPVKDKSTKSNSKSQIILFISGKEEQGLNGDLIQQTLQNNGLSLGENDIYHYFVEHQDKKNSLFRVANGVAPWSLTEKDLKNQTIAGISLVMLLPTSLENKVALHKFMMKADTITAQVNGILKNQQQEILNVSDRENIMKL